MMRGAAMTVAMSVLAATAMADGLTGCPSDASLCTVTSTNAGGTLGVDTLANRFTGVTNSGGTLYLRQIIPNADKLTAPGEYGSIFIGQGAGAAQPAGAKYDVAIGWNALATSAELLAENTAIGWNALGVGAGSGFKLNTALGVNAGGALTTGFGVTLLGNDAGRNVVALSGVTAVGKDAGRNGGGSYSTYLGAYAGSFKEGDQSYDNNKNTALGYEAMNCSNGGAAILNVAVGYQALRSCTTGGLNVISGATAGYAITTGSRNVFVGFGSGAAAISASDSTVIGYNAGALMTGTANTLYGAAVAPALTTGVVNLILGQGVGATLSQGSNNLLIGTANTCPTATGATSNYFCLAGGATAIMTATSIQGTPAVTIPGTLTVTGVMTLSAQPVYASSSTGAGVQTFTNSPCSGLTTARWIPVSITGQSGTWNVPACQ